MHETMAALDLHAFLATLALVLLAWGGVAFLVWRQLWRRGLNRYSAMGN